jgi:hypothetical protein
MPRNTFLTWPLPVWARKLRARLRYWVTQHYHPDFTGYFEKIGSLHALDPSLFSPHDPFKACQFSVSVIYPNLKLYTQAIHLANHHLRQRQAISNHWCAYTLEGLSLESFFIDRTSAKQIHLEPAIEVAAFKQTALEFFTLYRANSLVRVGDESHNTRILSKFEHQLHLLADRLLAYSLSQ